MWDSVQIKNNIQWIKNMREKINHNKDLKNFA